MTSPEPKARATAEPIAAAAGVELRVDRDLREAERGAAPVDDRAAFVARVDAWLGGTRVPGWEERDLASARIVGCIERLLAASSGDLALVSHGTVLSLYLSWLRGQERVDLREWEAIPLPAVAVVDPWRERSSCPGEESRAARSADPAVTAEWERALAAPPWDGPPVWHHGDLDARNWLVRDGRISGVIDWGAMGVGDPACDVMVAWKLHSPAARDAFREALPTDDATWERSRGWALSQAVAILAYYTPENNPTLYREAESWLDLVLSERE